MRYSVWNQSLGTYRVYEGSNLPAKIKLGGSSLGAAPEDVNNILPPDAKYMGESEFAVGEIVNGEYSIKSFLVTFAMIVSAGIFSRWLYERFF